MASFDKLEKYLKQIKKELSKFKDQSLSDHRIITLVQKACEYIELIIEQIEMHRARAYYDAENYRGAYDKNFPNKRQLSQEKIQRFLLELQQILIEISGFQS